MEYKDIEFMWMNIDTLVQVIFNLSRLPFSRVLCPLTLGGRAREAVHNAILLYTVYVCVCMVLQKNLTILIYEKLKNMYFLPKFMN